ncbi:MAG: hypothetical protein U5N10_10740 [Gemmobacter sp.]|nr:hypothetical protein [Gemmobacter sp.]
MTDPNTSLPADTKTPLQRLATAETQVAALIGAKKPDAAVALALQVFDSETGTPPWRRSILLARAMEAAGQGPEAVALLRNVDLTCRGQIHLAELLLRLDRRAEALAALPDPADLPPGNPVVPFLFRLRRARFLLAADQHAPARDLLTELAAEPVQDAASCLQLGWLGLKADLPDVARQAAAVVAGLTDASPAQVQDALAMLLVPALRGTDLPETVLASFTAHQAAHPEDLRLRLRLANLMAGHGHDATARVLLDIPPPGEAAPEDSLQLMQRQLQLDLPHQAATTAQACLQAGLTNPRHEARAVDIRAKALLLCGEVKAAEALLQEAVGRLPDEELERLLTLILRREGRQQDLAAVSEKIRHVQQSRLAGSLIQALEAVPRGTVPVLSEAPPALLVPWRLSGRPESDWPDWAARVGWGQAAGDIVRRWGIYGNAAHRRELLSLIDPPDLAVLEDALSQGRGAILVGTHMGPVAASFLTFETLATPFAYLGRGGAAMQTAARGILLAEMTAEESIGQMRGHLVTGGMLGMTLDAISAGGHRVLRIEGAECRFSRLAPRLSQIADAPSLWYQAEWVGGRLRVSLAPLPMASRQEPRAAWENRWFAAFETHLRAYLCGAPENLCGFWARNPQQAPLPEPPLSAWAIAGGLKAAG